MGGWITHRKTLYHDHILTVHKKFTKFTSRVRISLEQGVLTTHQGGPDFFSQHTIAFSFSNLKGGSLLPSASEKFDADRFPKNLKVQ